MENGRNSPSKHMKRWPEKVALHLPIPHALNQSFTGSNLNPNHPNEKQLSKLNQKESCDNQDSMKVKMKPHNRNGRSSRTSQLQMVGRTRSGSMDKIQPHEGYSGHP